MKNLIKSNFFHTFYQYLTANIVTIIFILILSLISCDNTYTGVDERDLIAPKAGNEINFANVKETELTVSWGEGSDNTTTVSELQYKLVQSSSKEELDTIEKAMASNNVLINWTQGLTTFTSSNLTANTKYAYTVLVRDSGGNAAIYEPKEITTSLVKVTGISLNKKSADISINSTENLIFAISPVNAADKNVTWTSSEISKVTVSSSGLVTGIAKGISIITVKTMDGGFLADCTVNVIANATVSTSNISIISGSYAAGGGSITDEGGGTVTAFGLCWSNSSNPTTADSKTIKTTGSGIFTSELTGLQKSTKYYVRSYVTNLSGTAYGNEVSFTTGTYNLRDVGPAGGLIFYENQNWVTDGWRYLEVAPVSTEMTNIKWTSMFTLSIGITTFVGVGYGESNTTLAVNWLILNDLSCANDAAYLCYNLTVVSNSITYDDWFLPSTEELWYIAWNLHGKKYENGEIVNNPDVPIPLGDFNSGAYWSSCYQGSAWVTEFHFSTCAPQRLQSNQGSAFRAVRAF